MVVIGLVLITSVCGHCANRTPLDMKFVEKVMLGGLDKHWKDRVKDPGVDTIASAGESAVPMVLDVVRRKPDSGTWYWQTCFGNDRS